MVQRTRSFHNQNGYSRQKLKSRTLLTQNTIWSFITGSRPSIIFAKQKKKSKFVDRSRIHVQIRVQITHITAWGVRLRTAGRGWNGRAYLADVRRRRRPGQDGAAPLASWSPLGKKGQEREGREVEAWRGQRKSRADSIGQWVAFFFSPRVSYSL
jgi:hypothetical protein